MKKKMVLALIIFVFTILVGGSFLMIFEKQSRAFLKKYIIYKVEANKETLDDAVKQIIESKINYITKKPIENRGLCYKELDIYAVTEIFENLKLHHVESCIDNTNSRFVDFYPQVGLSLFIWEKYSYCGFYYSSNDEAIDVFYKHEKCEEEFIGNLGYAGSYHYKTERINTNWWYYEVSVIVYNQ